MKMLIAEIGVNWNTIMQFESMLLELGEMGVKYAKGQLFTEDYLDGRLKDQVLTFDQAKSLMNMADDLGITLFWTPSHDDTVDMVIELEPKFIKIAHTHYNNENMAYKVNSSRIPIIVSEPALTQDNLNFYWRRAKVLLCNNLYTPSPEAHRTFCWIRSYNGVSLHSPYITPYIKSALDGLDIIEVHVKQNDDCIDSQVSLNMDEFRILKRELDFIWGVE